MKKENRRDMSVSTMMNDVIYISEFLLKKRKGIYIPD
jgi:hypothetical protein